MGQGKIGEGKERKERQISKEKWRVLERVLKDAIVNKYIM